MSYSKESYSKVQIVEIKNIENGYLIKIDNIKNPSWHMRQEIKLEIDMETDCCERPGYFLSEDNIESFIGSDFLGISLTDTALNEVSMENSGLGKDSGFEGGIMFVDILTSKGTLQFVAYNEHNGYYGHTAKVTSNYFCHEEIL